MSKLAKMIKKNKLVKKYQKNRKRKLEKLKAINLAYGTQDQVDLISYSGLKEESSYLQINDRYVRTLFVSGYPYVASTGWLNNLINFNHDIDISYHIEEVDPLSALPKLSRKITELERVPSALCLKTAE